jgi:hypothetical protein
VFLFCLADFTASRIKSNSSQSRLRSVMLKRKSKSQIFNLTDDIVHSGLCLQAHRRAEARYSLAVQKVLIVRLSGHLPGRGGVVVVAAGCDSSGVTNRNRRGRLIRVTGLMRVPNLTRDVSLGRASGIKRRTRPQGVARLRSRTSLQRVANLKIRTSLDKGFGVNRGMGLIPRNERTSLKEGTDLVKRVGVTVPTRLELGSSSMGARGGHRYSSSRCVPVDGLVYSVAFDSLHHIHDCIDRRKGDDTVGIMGVCARNGASSVRSVDPVDCWGLYPFLRVVCWKSSSLSLATIKIIAVLIVVTTWRGRIDTVILALIKLVEAVSCRS